MDPVAVVAAPPLPPGFVLDPPAAPPLPPGFVLDQPAPAQPTTPDMAAPTAGTSQPVPEGNARQLMLGTQAVGRGLAHVAGFPVDLTTAALNLGLTAGDKAAGLFGGSLPGRISNPVGGSQNIINTATGLAEKAGVPLATPSEDPKDSIFGVPKEKALGNVIDFGTQGLIGGLGLARAAAARAPDLVAGGYKRFGDAFLKPYLESPRAVIGDTASGAGAGAAIAGTQELPDSFREAGGGLGGAVADTIAGLAGGVTGAGAVTAARSPIRFKRAASGVMTDPQVPLDEALKGASRNVVNETRRFVDQTMTNPEAGRARLAERVNTAAEAGAPPPTAGIGSDDIGLTAMERGARLKNPIPFSEHDQKIVNYTQGEVTGLREPSVDQALATKAVRDKPDELAAARDAEALPLLRQAEASGAKVDAKPVADLIDVKLAEAKRPPVVAALTQARKMLNRAGKDELDNSVSGLYETRKAINDIIEGRTENATGRFAKKELIEVRTALDDAIGGVAPEFKQYLAKYKEGSQPLNALEDSKTLTQLATDDPRNVARRLLGGKEYGTEKAFGEVSKALEGKTAAQRSWRAAVSEALADQVTTTNTAITGGAEGPVAIAQLHKVFNRHREALSKVYDDKDMNTLQRVHNMLEPFGNLSRRAVTGSQTAENEQLVRSLEAGVLAYTGSAITTGMVMRRLRTAANLIGLQDQMMPAKVNKLVARMWFDPELADHLMRAPRPTDPPEWNGKLNRLLSYGQATRDKIESREEQ